jgi:beta-alanine--pyruvate transaminase
MNKPDKSITGNPWEPSPNNLESFWMGFTPNKSFKKKPRMIARAKDMHYYDLQGRAILDGSAGLWCCNAGHCRQPIVEAIQKSAAELDFAPTFQFGHPKVFELATRLTMMAPGDLNYAFFCNSGSEAADSALKMALAYHRARGEGTRTRLIGRERGYHGVNFGGISVGGMVANRKWFGSSMIPGVDHLPHTYNRKEQAYSKGEPNWGAHLADELERLVVLHDASTIAAVIIEPMAGSTGVLPPPKGYLKRLRELCDKHGILLIFDEVITGFGRLGTAFAAERFGVVPDLLTFAKGVTSGTVPMGGVLVRQGIYDTFINGAQAEHAIDLFHGYTYTGHPMAAAAGAATMDVYRDEKLFENATALESKWAEAAFALQGNPMIEDIRTIGIVAGIDLKPVDGKPGLRAYKAMENGFHDIGMLIRITADTIALSPPLTITSAQIDEIFFDKLPKIIASVASI